MHSELCRINACKCHYFPSSAIVRKLQKDLSNLGKWATQQKCCSMSLQGQAWDTLTDKNLNSSRASKWSKFNHWDLVVLCCSLGPRAPLQLQSNKVGIKLNKDWTEKSQYQQQCSTILCIWACLLNPLNMNTKELDKFWSRLSVIQHKNFQRQVGKVWLVCSRGDKQERKGASILPVCTT